MRKKKFDKYKTKTAKYKIGDVVRTSIQKSGFSRGYAPQFNDEKFVIIDVTKHLPIPLYSLRSVNKNDDIDGKYYQSEIFKVK